MPGFGRNDAAKPAEVIRVNEDATIDVAPEIKPALLDLSEHGLPRFEDDSKEDLKTDARVSPLPNPTTTTPHPATLYQADMPDSFNWSQFTAGADPIDLITAEEQMSLAHLFPEVSWNDYLQLLKGAVSVVKADQIWEALGSMRLKIVPREEDFNMVRFYEEYQETEQANSEGPEEEDAEREHSDSGDSEFEHAETVRSDSGSESDSDSDSEDSEVLIVDAPKAKEVEEDFTMVTGEEEN